jgi:hypothetical protein
LAGVAVAGFSHETAMRRKGMQAAREGMSFMGEGCGRLAGLAGLGR